MRRGDDNEAMVDSVSRRPREVGSRTDRESAPAPVRRPKTTRPPRSGLTAAERRIIDRLLAATNPTARKAQQEIARLKQRHGPKAPVSVPLRHFLLNPRHHGLQLAQAGTIRGGATSYALGEPQRCNYGLPGGVAAALSYPLRFGGHTIKVIVSEVKPPPAGDLERVADALARVPAYLRAGVRELVLCPDPDEANPGDPPCPDCVNLGDHVHSESEDEWSAAADADRDGVVRIYPGRRDAPELYRLMLHECAHLWSFVLATDEDRDLWRTAMQKDRLAVSCYGADDEEEDFAESVTIYESSEGALRDDYRSLFGRRFAELDKSRGNEGLDEGRTALLYELGRLKEFDSFDEIAACRDELKALSGPEAEAALVWFDLARPSYKEWRAFVGRSTEERGALLLQMTQRRLMSAYDDETSLEHRCEEVVSFVRAALAAAPAGSTAATLLPWALEAAAAGHESRLKALVLATAKDPWSVSAHPTTALALLRAYTKVVDEWRAGDYASRATDCRQALADATALLPADHELVPYLKACGYAYDQFNGTSQLALALVSPALDTAITRLSRG
jgi:hypothetical protein